MKYDLHIHSKYSYDSFLEPKKIIKVAKKRGLRGIAVTDHNTIKGGIKTKHINKDKDFEVVIGSEIKTEFGDVIGLFLSSEVVSRQFEEVIEEIHNQNGFIILAHPYRQYNSPEKLIENFDYIEGFNARSKKSLNDSSSNLAKRYNKAVLGGSDAHSAFEIGRGYTKTDIEIENALRKKETKIGGCETNYFLSHCISLSMEIIKKIK